MAIAGKEAVSDPSGAFTFTLTKAGTYEVTVERGGYFRLHQSLTLKDGENAVELVLSPIREVFQQIDVHPATYDIDVQKTEAPSTITGNEILFVPYPNTNNLRNALTMIPGVVQDQKGGLHVNGSAEEQVLYLLDGFNIGDPLTGKFESRFSVESVREVDVLSGRYSAEYGKGSAGALTVKTVSGDDSWRFSGTNFVPGLENRKGWIVGNWTPRFNVSGPILKGRAWFSNTADARYEQTVIEDIHVGKDRMESWRMSDMIRGQVNVTPSNIIYTGFLASFWIAPQTGLGILDPLETTIDRRTRQYFFHIKDSSFHKNGSVVEIGYAANRTFGREIPQGPGILVYTPEGRRGNYFANGIRDGGRDQWLANMVLPAIGWHGEHRLKTGIDLDRVSYAQDIHRTGVDFIGDGSVPVRSVRYAGSGTFSKANFEESVYVQDSWRVRSDLTLDLGMRQDWDQLIPHAGFSPRAAFAWAPFRTERTKVGGGYAMVYDASNLRLFTRPIDQFSLVTYLLSDGTVLRGPAANVYSIGGNVERPRYHNWSIGLEQLFSRNIFLRVNYLRRRSNNGLTYRNDSSADRVYWQNLLNVLDFDYLYALRNDRCDAYDGLEISVRRTFGQQYEWFASFVRSSARSNAVIDLNVDEPLLLSNNVGALPWDAPNRFMSWGVLPTPFKNWAIAYLADVRDGYPYFIQDDSGQVQGSASSRRFPYFFEANLHLERRFMALGHRWALRFGANNITDRHNPTVVNNITGSPNFGQFYGAEGRSFNFRIRWLGRR